MKKSCERCGAAKPSKDAGAFALFDYCAVCLSDLCDECMKKGCCGKVPAASGAKATYGDEGYGDEEGEER